MADVTSSTPVNIFNNQKATLTFSLANGNVVPAINANGFGTLGAITIASGATTGSVTYYPTSGSGTNAITFTTAAGNCIVPVTVQAIPLEAVTVTNIAVADWDGTTIV